MTIQVLQRDSWYGEPKKQGELFDLHKGKRRARCELWTHVLGWELSLHVSGDDLPRTQVCRSQEDVFTVFETWKAALQEKGWS